MKNILLATTAISAIVLTGCASGKITPAKEGTYQMNPHHKGEHKGEHKGRHHGNMHHKHAQGVITDTYQCDQGSKVLATYHPDAGEATITVTVPSLNLTNQDIKMVEAPAGSGMRFVNKVKAATEYSWHTKKGTAFLDVSTDGKVTTELKCEAERPKPKKKKR